MSCNHECDTTWQRQHPTGPAFCCDHCGAPRFDEHGRDDDDDDAYLIPEWNLSELAKRVETHNRRAQKHGFGGVTIESLEACKTPVRSDVTGEIVGARIARRVRLHAETPRMAGFALVARVEHTEAGNLISKAPAERNVDVSAWRAAEPWCQHCETMRARKDTFLVRELASGELRQIGRNCLADYIRSDDAAEAIRLWTLLEGVRSLVAGDPDSEGFGGVGCRTHVATAHFLACAARAIDLHGWQSRKHRDIPGTHTPTADDAAWAANPHPILPDEEARRAYADAQPTDANHDEAARVIEWAKSNEETSDFAENLRVACALEWVDSRREGLLAAAVYSYRRHIEREAARKAARARAADSEHFGAIGSRYVRHLTVIGENELQGDFGLTVIYKFEDDDGNRFVWFASRHAERPDGEELEIGDRFEFAFAVKEHREYQGAKETQITRAGTLAVPAAQAFKWLCPETGEIFKTKKALRAAQTERAAS